MNTEYIRLTDKLYYQLFAPSFYFLFLSFPTVMFIEKACGYLPGNVGDFFALLLFGCAFGLGTYLYGRMVIMRLCKIPVAELTETHLIVRSPFKKEVRIRYGAVKETIPYNLYNLPKYYNLIIEYKCDGEIKRTSIRSLFINGQIDAVRGFYAGLIVRTT